MDNEYQRAITITPMDGGVVVRYSDLNPNYKPYPETMPEAQYDSSVHQQWHSKQKIFVDSNALAAWFADRFKTISE